MDRDELKTRIKKIRGFNDILSFGETQAKRSIIEPICDSLDWDTSDPDKVRLEYSTSSGGRIDYAFLNNKKPIILLEAKKPAESLDNHGEQVLRYAFDIGAPLAVLTNGIEWWLYLPREDGHWEERKFYTIDILAQEIDSVCDRLIEFLGKDNVISGNAVDNAKKMRKSREGKQKIQATLPEVWEEIINEPNELLVELLIEETERKCGFKPSEQQAKNFIRKIIQPVKPLSVSPPVRPTRKSSSCKKQNGAEVEPEYIKSYRGQLNNPDNLISKIKRHVDNIGSIKRKKLKEVCFKRFGCVSDNNGSINASIRVLVVDGHITINGRGDSAIIKSMQK